MDRQLVAAFSSHTLVTLEKVARERAFLDELQKISRAAGLDSIEKLAAYYGYDDVETFIKESDIFRRAGRSLAPKLRKAYEGAQVGVGNLMSGHSGHHLAEGAMESAVGGGSVGKFLAGGGAQAIAHHAQKAAPHVGKAVKRVGKRLKKAVSSAPRGTKIPKGADVAAPALASRLRPVPAHRLAYAA